MNENITMPSNFIYGIIEKEKAEGITREIHTRFPPEPNGRLHIGSAKAIAINYLTAKKYNGKFNLRFDDTNPAKEDDSHVRAIEEDVKWLTGETPSGGIFFGSDYFEKCYELAVKLIKNGKAYVCDLTADEVREHRGTLTESGKNSPYRDRSVEENLTLFEKMKDGEFPDGFCTLRAKIDMASPNINMRDPAIYRITRKTHHRQGDKWVIYPLYDFAHPLQDYFEGITHSLCSLEFKNHRPLYEWVIENTSNDGESYENHNVPMQREFGRMNVTKTVMSKRYLTKLVDGDYVEGWDDPRMPTLSALRRRGYTPSAIFKFIELAGVVSSDSLVDAAMLEFCVREELNPTADRKIAILEPLKVTVVNYPEKDEIEYFKIPDNPAIQDTTHREVPFTKTLYIEKSDFAEVPPPKFNRLKMGGEVRLMGAYIVKLEEIIKDERGEATELLVSADLESRNQPAIDGRKVKGTIHWLSETNRNNITVINYDSLFTLDNTNDIPDGREIFDFLNPNSKTVYKDALIEKSADLKKGKYQFVRTGYYIADSKNENTFLQIVGLKSTFKV